MAAKAPVVFILGAGPGIGQAVARYFASNGYKVAAAARSLKEADSTDDQLHIPIDLSKTDDVANAFDKVKEVLGIPSVVVYNGESHSQLLYLSNDC
jgi:NAD(P)-dependent dehydrogenase (short-subunit alcohol dehydrogenase family)